MDRTLLEKKSVAELREIATALGLRGFQRLKKAELVDRIVSSASEGEHGVAEQGVAEQEATDRGAAAQGAASSQGNGDAGVAEAQATDQRTRIATAARTVTAARLARIGASSVGIATRSAGPGTVAAVARNGARTVAGATASVVVRGLRKLVAARGDDPDAEIREGVLDLLPEGYGFLRCTGYLAGAQDVYVSQSFVRRFDLRRGDLIAGPIRRNRNSDKFPALARVDRVEGVTFDPRADEARRPAFADLTPLSPDERLVLERPDGPLSLRLMDLLTPLGKGQRGLIVAPPRAGKTTVLKQVAQALGTGEPDLHVIALLVDARPEEVTDLQRRGDGEVVATTFDQPAEDHTQIAELVVERAKRLVERGRDVVVLLDSLTRLARAYNVVVPSSGRVLPGGVDPAALTPAKRLFAAARNVEGPGSLTIVASALVGAGSRMDETIVEGFVDTANMELHLDGGLAQQRILPAVDVIASGTRREERLLSEDELAAVARLRREVAGLPPEDGVPLLLDRLERSDTNERFVAEVAANGLG